MNDPFHLSLGKRRFLSLGLASTGLATLGVGSRVWAQALPVSRATARASRAAGRMVVVFLRGAYDGLSALVPYSDADYYALRPTIAIPKPDDTRETALRLDAHWALHPALEPLLPLWRQGVLAAIPTVGLPKANRSHFDAQYLMEIGLSDKSGSPVGWMNRLAHMSQVQALGVGESNPVILAGQAQVKLIPRGDQATRAGVLAHERHRQALLDLYSGDDELGQAFRLGVGSRMQTSQELLNEKNQRMQHMTAMQHMLDQDGKPVSSAARQAQMDAASNGAGDPVGLALDAMHLATVMRNDPSLRLGFLSAGGWDTHANQGAVIGQLANNLGNLARGLAQLRAEFSQPGDLIIVMSEFGRTCAENGTRGTDHGFGNTLWLMGNHVHGGRVHGLWTGLVRANLNENRDLPAHHDYRAVLAQALRMNFGLSDSQLQDLLPGANWDARLDALWRKA